MKILYLSPGASSSSEKLRERERILNSFVEKSNKVEIKSIKHGPISIESAVEEEIAASEIVKILPKISKPYDSIIIGCFGDPGLRAAREIVEKPIIGPAEATYSFSIQVADRFSVIVALSRDVPTCRELLIKYELSNRCSSIRPLNMPVLDIRKKRKETIKRILNIGRKMIDEDGAECIIPGCMSLAFLLAEEELEEKLKIPILNPAIIAVKIAEIFGKFKIMHSRRTYPIIDYKKISKII